LTRASIGRRNFDNHILDCRVKPGNDVLRAI